MFFFLSLLLDSASREEVALTTGQPTASCVTKDAGLLQDWDVRNWEGCWRGGGGASTHCDAGYSHFSVFLELEEPGVTTWCVHVCVCM